MKLKSIVIYLFFSTLVILQTSHSLYAQSYTIKTIFTTKIELVPGTGLTMTRIFNKNLSMNNKGDIIFSGVLSDGTRGIVFYSAGNIKLIAKSVVAQPLNESVFIFVDAPAINDNSDIVICANLSGKQGIYSYIDNNFIPLTLAGDPISGLEESTINEFACGGSGNLSLNNNGEIAFFGKLLDGRRGLFVLKEGGVESVVLEDDPFPVFNGAETLVSAGLPRINDKGDVVFRAAYFIDDSKEIIYEAIYIFQDGEFVPVKLPGQEAPGTQGQVFWHADVSRAALGNNSEVLYWAFYMESGKETESSTINADPGLFLWSNGVTKPLIIEGDPVPGFNKHVFTQNIDLLSQNTVNDIGEIVTSFNSNKNSGGVMLFSNDKVVPIVLGNTPPEGKALFFFGAENINNNGDVAFYAQGLNGNDQFIFLAIKEDVPFEIIGIEPSNGAKDSKKRFEIIGTGFQPGATISFNGNGIRVLKTDFNTSTTLIATVKINPHARIGLYDVIVTNPVNEEVVLEKGFRVR